MNPYLPSSVRKQREGLNVYRTDNGEVALKKIESNSFNPASSILPTSPREDLFLTHSSIGRKQGSEQERQDHLSGIKKEMGGYLSSVKERLNGSYICL